MATKKEIELFKHFFDKMMCNADKCAFMHGIANANKILEKYCSYTKPELFVTYAFDWETTPKGNSTWRTVDMLWKHRVEEFRNKYNVCDFEGDNMIEDYNIRPAASKCASIW